jgi:hypothetical protein
MASCGAGGAARFDVDDRLVEQYEFSPLQAGLDLSCQRRLAAQPAGQLAAGEARVVAAAALGGMAGGFGAADQLLGGGAVTRTEGDADRNRHVQQLFILPVWLGHALQHAVGQMQQARVVRHRRLAQQRDELVAAVAEQPRLVRQQAPQALRSAAEIGVA